MEAVYFHPYAAKGDVWCFLSRAGERFLKRCCDLDVERCDLRCLPLGDRHPHSLVGLRFQAAEQFSSAFFPDDVGLLFDAVVLGLKMPGLIRCRDIRLAEGIEFMTGFPHGSNLDRYFASPEMEAHHWSYTVKSDFSLFESGDPICCIANKNAPTFEAEITQFLLSRGFVVHSLPLTGPLILNWTEGGELPLLQSRPR